MIHLEALAMKNLSPNLEKSEAVKLL